MTDYELTIKNNLTIETVLQSIINETSKWGFKPADYIKLVNALLDLSLNKPNIDISKEVIREKQKPNKLTFPLEGDHIYLRLFNKGTDYEIANKWMEDEVGRWFLLSMSHSITNLNQLIEEEENIFGLITLHDSSPIGLMGYLNYDPVQQKAEMRKLIGEEKFREKGYAKEATILWMQYGLSNMGLKKIYLNTIDNNIRNVTINKELGFQIEGILRKECHVDSHYFDVLRMAYISEDNA